MRNRTLLCMALTLAIGWCLPMQADAKPVDGKKNEPPKAKKKRSGKPAPKVGETAPLFKLKMLDSEKVVDLKSLAKKKPVLLFFGSYT